MANMEECELDYDVQEMRLSEEHVFKVTTVANEALPLEMLLDLETRRYNKEQRTKQRSKHHTDRRTSVVPGTVQMESAVVYNCQ